MSAPLSKYRNAFGKPRTGIHAYRLPGDVVLVDTALTIAAAYLITYKFKVPISYSMIGMFGLGIIAHKLVGLPT
jgi:hypothetical protein